MMKRALIILAVLVTLLLFVSAMDLHCAYIQTYANSTTDFLTWHDSSQNLVTYSTFAVVVTETKGRKGRLTWAIADEIQQEMTSARVVLNRKDGSSCRDARPSWVRVYTSEAQALSAHPDCLVRISVKNLKGLSWLLFGHWSAETRVEFGPPGYRYPDSLPHGTGGRLSYYIKCDVQSKGDAKGICTNAFVEKRTAHCTAKEAVEVLAENMQHCLNNPNWTTAE